MPESTINWIFGIFLCVVVWRVLKHIERWTYEKNHPETIPIGVKPTVYPEPEKFPQKTYDFLCLFFILFLPFAVMVWSVALFDSKTGILKHEPRAKQADGRDIDPMSMPPDIDMQILNKQYGKSICSYAGCQKQYDDDIKFLESQRPH